MLKYFLFIDKMSDMANISATSAHPRIGWCFEALKVGESLELHLFKKKSRGNVELYAPSGNGKSKAPFGQIVKIEFVVKPNSNKIMTEGYQLTNEDNKIGFFEIRLLDMHLKEQNAFTTACGQFKLDKKYQLLSMYLTLLVRSKNFSSHNEDLFYEDGFCKDIDGLQVQDLVKNVGSQEEYKQILKLALENASLSDNSSQPRNRKITQYFSKEPSKKLTKQEFLEKTFEEELNDEVGVEKVHSLAYEGRADIPITNLSVSPFLGLPVNQAKVSGIQRSMLERFNPAGAAITVSPIDGSSVDLKNIGDQKFYVVHGVHSFLAMQNLHAKGLFSALLGVEKDCVLCFVVNLGNQPAGHNYANLRDNEISFKFQTEPSVHLLIYVFNKLKLEYKEKGKAVEVIERIARLMKVQADDLSALRKICVWPDNALRSLVLVLINYEKYNTQDAYEQKRKASMKSGMPLKITKSMFKLIGTCNSQYFEDNVCSVLDNKISLKSLLNSSKKSLEIEKVNTSLLEISKYQTMVALDVQYPEKFTPEVLEKYAGAEVSGRKRNVQGALLQSYFKSVVEKNDKSETLPIVVTEYENIVDVKSEMLEKNDLVIIKLKNFHQEYVQYVIDTAGCSFKDTFAVLILSASGAEQLKVLSMTKAWEEKEGFSVTQIFFEKDAPAKGRFGFVENLDYSVLLGKVHNHGKDMPVLFENMEQTLSTVLDNLCPNNGKIAIVIGPNTDIPDIGQNDDRSWSSATYYGNQMTVKKFKEKLLKESVPVPHIDINATLVQGSPNVTENLEMSEESLNRECRVDQESVKEGKEAVVKDVQNVCDGEAENAMSVYDFEENGSHGSINRQSSTSKY